MPLGENDGAEVDGTEVGAADGAPLGVYVSFCIVGRFEGVEVGENEGAEVGASDGVAVGVVDVGAKVGATVGMGVGNKSFAPDCNVPPYVA